MVLLRHCKTCSCNCSKLSASAPLYKRIMMSPLGRECCSSTARTRRFKRLRTTAFLETLLSTITATLLSVAGFLRKEQATTPRDRLFPRRRTLIMSRVVRILRSCANTRNYLNFFFSLETVKLARPLRRRAARTRRPLAVNIRCIKPWTRTRWRLLGRNVGCMRSSVMI